MPAVGAGKDAAAVTANTGKAEGNDDGVLAAAMFGSKQSASVQHPASHL